MPRFEIPEPKTQTFHSLFPVFDSYNEFEEYAASCVPVHTHNEMYGLLQVARNTLLREVNLIASNS